MFRFRQLRFKYPQAYSRLLHVALVAVVFGGLVSLATPRPVGANPAQHLAAAGVIAGPRPEIHISATAEAAAVASPTVSQVLPLASSSLSGSTKDPYALARSMNAQRFGDQYWPDLNRLWVRESGWNPNAHNYSSGACGIPQALPCSKIDDHSTMGQIAWGLDYIAGRYGNPHRAWEHWQAYHWY